MSSFLPPSMTKIATRKNGGNSGQRSISSSSSRRRRHGGGSCRKKAIPLVQHPPMKSRKKARKVTTLFHKLTRDRDLAMERGDTEQVQKCDQLLEQMGGRIEYQRASQLSTQFHSTSKWVLGQLAKRGWLYGICSRQEPAMDHEERDEKRRPRRPTRLLEVGAINTELLDAAMEKRDMADGKGTAVLKYKLDVRAIDIHAMNERIEEANFLTLPFRHEHVDERYDVIVCSMVLNCVTTPNERGKMLARLFHHLRPSGLLFMTIPKFCLTKSAFLTPGVFQELLGSTGVGFLVEETRESPRVAFFVCRRPEGVRTEPLLPEWTKTTIRNKGRKFPNQFSVMLEEDEVFGRVPMESSL